MRSFFAYGVVSATCLALHNVIVIGGHLLGWPYFCSILVSFGLVTTIGYSLQSQFTFKEALDGRRYLRYLVAMSANIPLALIALWIWHDLVKLAMIWASPVATLSMVAVNFLLSRWAILSQSTRMI